LVINSSGALKNRNRIWHSLTLLVRVGSPILLVGTVCLEIAFPAPASPQTTSISPAIAKQSDRHLTEAQLQVLARSITVKVKVGKTSGSGIMVHKRGRVYAVVTNQHVLDFGDRASSETTIETADGRTYPAKVRQQGLGNRDLALLQFQSKTSYAIASLERRSSVQVGDEVFAAGFPTESELGSDRDADKSAAAHSPVGFTFVPGQVSLLVTKVLAGGYQIGCTNDVRKGMSGGPLLNRRGKVVGINGMHAYPIWGDPFVFTDGSHPERSQHEVMMRSSWAIPIETFRKLFKAF
jgi:S1-C subfamily serine protease